MGDYLDRRRLLVSGALGGAAIAASGLVAPTALAAPEKIPTSGGKMPANLFGPKPGFAKLSQNENPYGPAPGVKAAVLDAVTSGGAYYADTAYLAAMIAEKNGIKPEQVSLSCGSIEGLTAAAMAYGAKGKLVVPSLFWETPYIYAEKKGAKVHRVPLKADYSIDLAAMEAAVDDATALVHICNPNNPTGLVLDGAELKAFCLRVSKKATVLVDEAYIELLDHPSKQSMMDLVRAGENVIVARTFSKIYGMAGMRIGYMMTTPANKLLIDGYIASWLGVTQVAAAVAAYHDEKFLKFSKAKIDEGRALVFAAVKSAGLTCLPSQTNFVWVKVPDAARLLAQMADRKITIRGVYGPHVEWSRVSMGKIADVRRYCSALKEIMGA